MNLASIQAAESKLLLQTYERNPYLFVSGQGVYLRDENGKDYLDLLSGIGVSALGYAHPAVEEAIQRQSKRLIHTSNLFFHEHTVELAPSASPRSAASTESSSPTAAPKHGKPPSNSPAPTQAAPRLKAATSAQSFSPSNTASTAAPWAPSQRPIKKNTASPSNP